MMLSSREKVIWQDIAAGMVAMEKDAAKALYRRRWRRVDYRGMVPMSGDLCAVIVCCQGLVMVEMEDIRHRASSHDLPVLAQAETPCGHFGITLIGASCAAATLALREWMLEETVLTDD